MRTLSRQLVRLNDAPSPSGPQKVVAQWPGERQDEETPDIHTHGTQLDCENECEQDTVSLEGCAPELDSSSHM